MGQQNTAEITPITFGVEQDVLPYALGGFIATGWIGKNQFRHRFSYAHATSPKLVYGADTKSDAVRAFGISFEYFFKEDFKGWWLGPGVGYWTNLIETNNLQQLRNESVIFTFGGGYNFFITDWLYTSPWIALHTRVSGNETISVGNESYTPAILTPELSVKLGIKLPLGKK